MGLYTEEGLSSKSAKMGFYDMFMIIKGQNEAQKKF